MMIQMLKIRVATANIAGAARGENAHPQKFELLGQALAGCDIVGLQEVIRVTDGSMVVRDDVNNLLKTPGRSGYHHFFFAHLDSTLHPHPAKWSGAAFKEYYEKGDKIEQGSAILSRYPFRHLLVDGVSEGGSAQI